MNTARGAFAAMILVLVLGGVPARAQWTVTAGVKGWAPTWDLTINRDLGVEQSDYSSAVLLGPSLTVRYGRVSLAGSYAQTLRHFEATAGNAGLYSSGFNGTRWTSRRDVNILLNFPVPPEFAVFGTVKLLHYEVHDALTYINGMFGRMGQTYSGTGIGGGVNVGIPFSGRNPFYAFMSSGVLSNNLTSDDQEWILVYNGQESRQKVPVGETLSELVYFLDAGLGLRVPATNLGVSTGVRVETATNTKTIVGPTLSVYYALLQP
jgi:hypothetical protein